jgi:triacylglycerol lipase
MNSRHLVDPDLLELLDALPALQLSAQLLPEVRAAMFPFPADPEAAKAVAMETRTVPRPPNAPPVGVRIYAPKQRTGTLPCIFHMHGGGFVAGSAASREPLHQRLALAADCVILSVDYRLAPETPFPGSVEDCYAALGWAFGNAAALGVDATRIGVMGESTGGGLAAALALLVRDRREHALSFQHLIYPMLDDRTCISPDPHPYAGEFVWTVQTNTFGWSSLLGAPPGGDGVSPYAAPARAADLAGLPPTFISTGALDLFVEEDLAYARRLMSRGVPVELHVYPGAFHAFDFTASAEISRNARRDSLNSLRRALHPRRAAALSPERVPP